MKSIPITKVAVGEYFTIVESGTLEILIRVAGEPEPPYTVRAAIVDSAVYPKGDLTQCRLFTADWEVLV